MIKLKNIGLIGYNKAFEMQKAEKQAVLNNKSDGTIYFLEHNPVITVGLNAGRESILLGESLIKANHYEICKTSRGGDVTVHEPGQLVVYFVLPLKQKGVKSFVEDIIETVRFGANTVYGINSIYDNNRPGLYVGDKKLCSVGFDLRGRVSMHGIAININNTMKGFKLINPCGYAGLEMCSVSSVLKQDVQIEPLIKHLKNEFRRIFN